MVSEKDYSVLPEQQAYKIKPDDCPVITEPGALEDEESNQEIRETVITNDFHVTYTTGEPGDIIPWHTHMPSLYQVLITLEGECIWYYKDNDGEEQSIHAEPGDIVYLPGGAENKVEVVGEDSHTHIGIYPKVPIPRVEQLVGDAENTYDPWELSDSIVGLRIDTDNDEVRHMDEDAVSTE